MIYWNRKMPGSSTSIAVTLTLLILGCDSQSVKGRNELVIPIAEPQERFPRVCDNGTLLRAIRIINRACNDTDCDFENLKELNGGVEKGALFEALRNNDLRPVHVFFPENVSDISRSFDWNTIKQAQIDSLKYADSSNSVVFVLGRASLTGNREHNIRLSRERMTAVLTYLKYTLKIKCKTFRGAWFGNEVLYLYGSDAAVLGIPKQDWRDNQLVLNQAVHVFVVPCGELIVG